MINRKENGPQASNRCGASRKGGVPKMALAAFAIICFAVLASMAFISTDADADDGARAIFHPGEGATAVPDTYYKPLGDDTLYIPGSSFTVYEDSTPVVYTYTKEGYHFLGWSEVDGATVPQFTEGNIIPSHLVDYDLYAVWAPNEYDVTFDYGTYTAVVKVPWHADPPFNSKSYMKDVKEETYGNVTYTYKIVGWSTLPLTQEASTHSYVIPTDATTYNYLISLPEPNDDLVLYPIWAQVITVADGTNRTISNSAGCYYITGSTSTGSASITITGAVSGHPVYIYTEELTMQSRNASPFVLKSGANVVLTTMSNCSFTGGAEDITTGNWPNRQYYNIGYAAINVQSGTTLTISDLSVGTLTAQGGDAKSSYNNNRYARAGAGIGSNGLTTNATASTASYDDGCGTIIINGGFIIAEGGSGIQDGRNYVNRSGGTVSAQALGGTGATVNIYGGTVNATSGMVLHVYGGTNYAPASGTYFEKEPILPSNPDAYDMHTGAIINTFTPDGSTTNAPHQAKITFSFSHDRWVAIDAKKATIGNTAVYLGGLTIANTGTDVLIDATLIPDLSLGSVLVSVIDDGDPTDPASFSGTLEAVDLTKEIPEYRVHMTQIGTNNTPGFGTVTFYVNDQQVNEKAEHVDLLDPNTVLVVRGAQTTDTTVSIDLKLVIEEGYELTNVRLNNTDVSESIWGSDTNVHEFSLTVWVSSGLGTNSSVYYTVEPIRQTITINNMCTEGEPTFGESIVTITNTDADASIHWDAKRATGTHQVYFKSSETFIIDTDNGSGNPYAIALITNNGASVEYEKTGDTTYTFTLTDIDYEADIDILYQPTVKVIANEPVMPNMTGHIIVTNNNGTLVDLTYVLLSSGDDAVFSGLNRNGGNSIEGNIVQKKNVTFNFSGNINTAGLTVKVTMDDDGSETTVAFTNTSNSVTIDLNNVTDAGGQCKLVNLTNTSTISVDGVELKDGDGYRYGYVVKGSTVTFTLSEYENSKNYKGENVATGLSNVEVRMDTVLMELGETVSREYTIRDVSQDMYITVTLNHIKHTVKYASNIDDEHQSVHKGIKVVNGALFALPTVDELPGLGLLVKEGYDLDYWETGGASTDKPKPGEYRKITNSSEQTVEYYAHWGSAHVYKITYNLGGGSWPEWYNVNDPERSNPSTYTIESSERVLINPVRPGYIFLGWEGEGLRHDGDTYTFEIRPLGDRTLTALWEIDDNIEVTLLDPFDIVTNISPNPMIFTYGDHYNGLPLLSNVTIGDVKYSFGGWAHCNATYDEGTGKWTIEELDRIINTSTVLAGNHYLSIVWIVSYDEPTYVINIIESDGGRVMPSVKRITETDFKAEGAYISFTAYPQDGYRLSKLIINDTEYDYTVEQSVNSTSRLGIIITERLTYSEGMDRLITVHSEFVPIVYTITVYDRDNNPVTTRYPTYMITDNAIYITHSGSQVPGYAFRGFSGTGIGDGVNDVVTYVTIEKGSFGDRVYHEQWVGLYYTITYDPAEYNAPNNPTYYQVGTITNINPGIEREGYTFMGWYENSAHTGQKIQYIGADRTGEITLYAYYEVGTLVDFPSIKEYHYKGSVWYFLEGENEYYYVDTSASGSTNEGINAGSYRALVVLKDKVMTKWEDGTADDQWIEWSIIKRDVFIIGNSQSTFYDGTAWDLSSETGYSTVGVIKDDITCEDSSRSGFRKALIVQYNTSTITDPGAYRNVVSVDPSSPGLDNYNITFINGMYVIIEAESSTIILTAEGTEDQGVTGSAIGTSSVSKQVAVQPRRII
jgi:uncharacterized repeat protein (TIGR02543 family)